MKRHIFILTISCLALSTPALAQYSRYFLDKTMRVDLYHTGTKGQETISLNRVYQEGEWPGTRTQLLAERRGEHIRLAQGRAVADEISPDQFSRPCRQESAGPQGCQGHVVDGAGERMALTHLPGFEG